MRRLHIEGVSTRGCLTEGLAVSIAWAERGENCQNRQEGEGPYAAYTETSIFRPKKIYHQRSHQYQLLRTVDRESNLVSHRNIRACTLWSYGLPLPMCSDSEHLPLDGNNGEFLLLFKRHD